MRTQGKIITFFSYKGGVGRSMALANVAVLLARWGHRILMVDWDLEAPGLETFFSQLRIDDEYRQKGGVIDLLDAVPEATVQIAERSEWEQFVAPIGLEAPGELHLLRAGVRDSEYYARVRKLDIETLYSAHAGGVYIEALRSTWRNAYDFVLIDSRTGITDIGGICTVQLPDILVLLFTATEQAFQGALEVAEKAAAARQRLPYERLQVPVVPIPSRFDAQQEFSLSQKWLDRFANDLRGVFRNWLPGTLDRRAFLELTKLPYMSYFSFGEKLPVLEQGTTDPTGLGYAYESLAALLATHLEAAEWLVEDRDRLLEQARFRKPRTRQIVLFYHRDDEGWARQLASYLTSTRHWGGPPVLLTASDLSDDPANVTVTWREPLRDLLTSSAILAPMVSPSLLEMELLSRQDFVQLVADQADEGLKVVPLIARPCPWRNVPWMAGNLALPKHETTLSRTEDIETALSSIATELQYLAGSPPAQSPDREADGVQWLSLGSSAKSAEFQTVQEPFDVFLGYNPDERAVAETLARALETRGIRVWLDLWNLIPGEPWQGAIEQAIEKAPSIALLFGAQDSESQWLDATTMAALSRAVWRKTRVIPVYLPGASYDKSSWPLFLSQLHWVDLRDGLEGPGLERLIWGIQGQSTKRNA